MSVRHRVFDVFEIDFRKGEWTRDIEPWGVRYIAKGPKSGVRITPAPGANGKLYTFDANAQVLVTGGLVHIPG